MTWFIFLGINLSICVLNSVMILKWQNLWFSTVKKKYDDDKTSCARC